MVCEYYLPTMTGYLVTGYEVFTQPYVTQGTPWTLWHPLLNSPLLVVP